MRHLIIPLALVACSQTVPQKPTAPRTSRGLHADEHLDAAREHARRASELARWPDTRLNDGEMFGDPSTGLWYRAWDKVEDQRRLAATHQASAAQLHAAYDEACANLAPEVASVSPIQRYGNGAMEIDDGVVIFMSADAVTADRLLAELRCHRAWMRLSAQNGMDLCPLDLPNLRIQAHGDATGISVELHVTDKKLVSELQQRAARDLEAAPGRHGAR